MRGSRVALLSGVLAIVVGVVGVAFGRQLGAREARERIAELVSSGSPDAVRIKSITPGMIGNEAIVEADVRLAFRMTETDSGWRVADVRLGANRWENVEMLQRALDKEKGTVAVVDLRDLATGVEAYRQERGFYPDVKTVAELVDHISPRFLPRIIRVDPWHNPYQYRFEGGSFGLSSDGPDGRANTGDDVIYRRS